MVLFTLLGLYAFLQRERKQVINTHSGQDENVDQSDNVPHVESHDGQTSSQDITSDPEVLPTAEEPVTGDPEVDDDWIDDAFHVFNRVMCKYNVDSFQTPVHVVPDMSVDVPQASDSRAEDTVAPQSQQQNNKRTIMECGDFICCCLQNDPEKQIGLEKVCLHNWFKEGYSEPLPLELVHQHSEDKERDGASNNETELDSGVPEVPVPADDTSEVLNKVLSGLSSRSKNWLVWGFLTLVMISSFFMAFYLGPMPLMMVVLCVQIKYFHEIITIVYSVYRPVHTAQTDACSACCIQQRATDSDRDNTLIRQNPTKLSSLDVCWCGVNWP